MDLSMNKGQCFSFRGK